MKKIRKNAVRKFRYIANCKQGEFNSEEVFEALKNGDATAYEQEDKTVILEYKGKRIIDGYEEGKRPEENRYNLTEAQLNKVKKYSMLAKTYNEMLLGIIPSKSGNYDQKKRYEDEMNKIRKEVEAEGYIEEFKGEFTHQTTGKYPQ